VVLVPKSPKGEASGEEEAGGGPKGEANPSQGSHIKGAILVFQPLLRS
jgi:hypothetical protein